MSEYFCGVDSGGTSTRAIVASNETGRWGWGYAAGGNPSHQGWTEAGVQIGVAVRAAALQARVAPAEITSIFCGMAGVISSEDRAAVVSLAREWGLSDRCAVGVDHDIRIALQGGLSGRPGIALIAGTGSSCYGRNENDQSWQAGGWDQLLDDLGSGYDLAQRGLAAACQSADGRIAHSSLQEMIFEALEVNNVIDLCVKIHRPRMERHAMAALAPLVLQAAQAEDSIAIEIVNGAANELARMVAAVSQRLFPEGDPELVFVGSLLEKSDTYRATVERCISSVLPRVRFRAQEQSPAVGAWTLAALQTGSLYSAAFTQEFSSTQSS